MNVSDMAKNNAQMFAEYAMRAAKSEPVDKKYIVRCAMQCEDSLRAAEFLINYEKEYQP